MGLLGLVVHIGPNVPKGWPDTYVSGANLASYFRPLCKGALIKCIIMPIIQQ